ncbi:MAG: M1 family metallopeptidase [Calditrichaeota bacterium]|nr:M1 family metallopeptidase [Calditrichota bacterium]
MIRTLVFLLLLPLVLHAQIDETPPANPSEFHEQEASRLRRAIEVRENLSLDETQTDFDVLYYELWLDLRNFAGQQITGQTDVHGKALIPAFRHVVLDMCDTLVVDSVIGAGNQPLIFVHGGYQLTVTLEQDYAVDEEFAFSVYYHGHPCLGGGLSTFDWFNRFVTPGSYYVPSISTLSEPTGARDWWPCKDRPDDKADSARIRLIVADTLTATSNGVLEDITLLSGSSVQYNWFEKNPISSYLIVANASNYAHFSDWYVSVSGDSLPLDYYVYPEKLTASVADFDIMPSAIAALAEKFGEYPFMDEKYGHSMFRWGGAMEHQCNTSYGRSLVNGAGTYDWILVHELGHQWWGDMVTLSDWPHIWLNEGFASYSEALWYEHLSGASGLQNYMVNNQFVSDPSGPVVNPTELFDGNTVYNKGAWVVHTLRGAIANDSLFFAGLREYRERFAYGAANTEEFLQAMSDVAGFDVTPFVYAYLYETNRPYYRVSYGTGTVDGALKTAVRLRQIHVTPAVPFTNRVELRFGGAQTVTQSVVCSTYREEYLFDLGYSPSSLTFDPNSWFLKTVANDPLQPVFLNDSLSAGTQYQSYADTLVAIGGTGSYTYSLIGGSLPAGVTLNSSGLLTGMPMEGGAFPLTFRVVDTNSQADTTGLVLNVAIVPDPPQEVTLAANGDDTVTLRWLGVENASTYEIIASEDPFFFSSFTLATVSDTFYVDTVSAEQMFYVVIAIP